MRESFNAFVIDGDRVILNILLDAGLLGRTEKSPGALPILDDPLGQLQ
jgi:hypothetical protein